MTAAMTDDQTIPTTVIFRALLLTASLSNHPSHWPLPDDSPALDAVQGGDAHLKTPINPKNPLENNSKPLISC